MSKSSAQSIADVGDCPGDIRKSPVIALFPGAFKPPHASHVDAIRYLLENIGVDKVIVIISNRCRVIPGTSLALDSAAATLLFQILVNKAGLPSDKIEFELASHRATSHAFTHLEEAEAGTELLFCIGEEDSLSDDNRFSRIGEFAQKHGVSARVEVIPVSGKRVHSSQLRRFIANGYSDRDPFFECLPAEMSANDKMSYWSLSNCLPRPVHEIVRSKIHVSLEHCVDLLPEKLRVVDVTAVDPVFEFRDAGAQLYTVKYSGDTTGNGAFGVPDTQMPAGRVPAERRATRHLTNQLPISVFHSRIEMFDREKRVLVLRGRPANAWTIASEIECNKFCIDSAGIAGKNLATLHRCPTPDTPFWGDGAADENHWVELVDGLRQRASRIFQARCGKTLCDQRHSRYPYSGRPMVVHLNYCAENLFRSDDACGIENFECAGSFGDAAYDVAALVADYVAAGVARDAEIACFRAIDRFECSYRSHRAIDDPCFSGRVAIYCAYRLLCKTAKLERVDIADVVSSMAVQLLAAVDASKTGAVCADVASLLRQHRIATAPRYDSPKTSVKLDGGQVTTG